jgi:HKD family nuclease
MYGRSRLENVKQNFSVLRIKVLQSTPLSPIAVRMRQLTERADEFWATTAFLSREAVTDVIEGGLAARTRIRLLTGIFGRQTRRETFQHLLRLNQKQGSQLETRIWDCGRHRNLHAKLYLWQNGTQAVAWLGSANMTVGGLQAEGELVFEFRGMSDSPVFRTLIRAFDQEWQRSVALDQVFLQDYREAPRSAPDMRLISGARHLNLSRTRRNGFFATSVAHEYGDESRVFQRVDKLLGGIPDPWIRHRIKGLMRMRRGDACLIVSRPSRILELGRVTDVKRDGDWHIFSYRSILSVSWNRTTYKVLVKAGVRARYPQGPRTQWMDWEYVKQLKQGLLARRGS